MNREDQVLEPTMGTELSPTMEPEPSLATTVPASATPPKRYWQAQSFADTLRREFDQARHQGNMSLMRRPAARPIQVGKSGRKAMDCDGKFELPHLWLNT